MPAGSRETSTSIIYRGATMVRQSGRGRFVIVEGPDRGESIPMERSPLTLGSGSGSDVVLSDPTISRRHLLAAIEERGAGVLVRDLGSTNGSFVQGVQFRELVVGFGAEIQIGNTVLKYVPEEEAVDLPPSEGERFGSLLGRDPKMRKLFGLLGEVAATDATVLLEGETGTGKELLAEEIHSHSARRDKPFVVFDCGAVPRELIESALFGHVRGAFTGAINDRRGAFVEADGGTLFLDEIGELAIEMQPALLRALDKRMVRPVGGGAYQTVDIRVVAATNRNLRAEVAARRFREDLYYRLAVIRLGVPPLRERPEDVELLAEHFARDVAGGRRPVRVTQADVERLRAHGWPGNVRELRNVIERAALLGRQGALDLEQVLGDEAPPSAGGSVRSEGGPSREGASVALPYKAAKTQVLDDFERAYFKTLVERHGGNVSAAAREAQIDRKHLRELLRKYGLLTPR